MERRKYPRTCHFPFSPGTTSDDRIARDVASLFGEPVVITEKLDGENTCLNRYGVFARSHGAPTRNPWATYLWDLWNRLKNDLGDLEIFGESLYAVHSLEYTGLPSHFFVFAVREGDHWLSWEDVETYARLADLPSVPVVYRGTLSAETLEPLILRLVTEPSALADPDLGLTQREGIVARLERSFGDVEFASSVFKWVRKGHVQTTEHWTRHWRRAPLNHERRAMEGLRP